MSFDLHSCRVRVRGWSGDWQALLTASAGFAGVKLQFPRPKDQAVLSSKAGIIRGRILADARKKTKQAEKMLGNAASVSSSAKKKGTEAALLAKNSAKVRATDVMTVGSLWENCHGRVCPCRSPLPWTQCRPFHTH